MVSAKSLRNANCTAKLKFGAKRKCLCEIDFSSSFFAWQYSVLIHAKKTVYNFRRHLILFINNYKYSRLSELTDNGYVSLVAIIFVAFYCQTNGISLCEVDFEGACISRRPFAKSELFPHCEVFRWAKNSELSTTNAKSVRNISQRLISHRKRDFASTEYWALTWKWSGMTQKFQRQKGLRIYQSFDCGNKNCAKNYGPEKN